MRILIDECLDWRLCQSLTDHACTSVQRIRRQLPDCEFRIANCGMKSQHVDGKADVDVSRKWKVVSEII